MKSSTIYIVKVILIMYSLFSKKKILCDWFSTLPKKSFFFHVHAKFLFRYLSFYQLICFRKRDEIYHKMQRAVLYNLQRTVCLNKKKEFLIRVQKNDSSQRRKLFTQNFDFVFENRRWVVLSKMSSYLQ